MPLFTRRHALALAAASVCSLALPARAAPLDGVFYPDLAGKSQGLTGAWRGKVVVLNFWATWCAPCREEMPMLNQYADRYGAAPLAVVGVAIDDKTAVRNFVRQFNIRYPVLLGDGVALFRPLGVETSLELVESVAYPSGLVRLTYRRVN